MDIIETILEASRRIINSRTVYSVNKHLQGEADELDYEVFLTVSGAEAGKDGILGEAVDVILCAVDLIYKDNPNITKEEILAKVKEKLDKWERLYGNA